MCRPEGWKEIKLRMCRCASKECDTCSNTIEECSYDFEAGADAMLEALCTDENKMDCIDQYGTEPPKNVKGWLVFIPEED